MPKAKYSPCIKVCTYDDEGYCLGCQRTETEVKTWRDRTEQEQLDGIDMLRERKLWRLSENGSKNITSGAGGVISTEKFKYYDFAFKFSNNGKILNAYDYKMIGFNLKMSSLNAALGLGQLKRFNYLLKKKKKSKIIIQKI